MWPHWQCQQTPAQMIQTHHVFSSPVVRVTSFQALEVTPAIKQAVTVPCGANSRTDARTALRLTVEPVCLKWHAYFVFCLFLLLEAFVCCIWNALSSRWAEREDLFHLSIFYLVGLCLQNSPNMKQLFQFIYTPWKTSATFSILAFLHQCVIKYNCTNKDGLLLFFYYYYWYYYFLWINN